jgi:thiol-disulfide isomerase/thioredoxin
VFVAAPSDDRGAASAADLPSTAFELFDGGETTLADFAGTPLVGNFWASWCPACVAELPEIQAVHERFGDDVTILGIANSDERGAALSLADDVGLTYTLADDPGGELFRELGLFAMPSTIFITADGEISEVFGGQLDEDGLLSRTEPLGATS